MTSPYKKTIGVTAALVALVLISLLALGIRQYLLFQKHEEVTAHTEKIIFQFAIIREHITEALLEKKYQRLAGVAGEMEELNVNLSNVLASDYVLLGDSAYGRHNHVEACAFRDALYNFGYVTYLPTRHWTF